jgi:hypothetical protein
VVYEEVKMICLRSIARRKRTYGIGKPLTSSTLSSNGRTMVAKTLSNAILSIFLPLMKFNIISWRVC